MDESRGHYDKWNRPDLYVETKIVELIETQSRMVVAEENLAKRYKVPIMQEE